MLITKYVVNTTKCSYYKIMLTTSTIIKNNPLFAGIAEEDFENLLTFLNAQSSSFSKGETVLHAGSLVTKLGIVQEGRVQIENTDFWGNKTIIDSLGEGKIFAETYALTLVPLKVDVVATQDSKILFLDVSRIESGNETLCSKDCNKCKNYFSQIISKNLLSVAVKKNLRLSSRIFHTSSKTIRGRLLSYLSSQVPHGTPNAEFDIPFDRQQLADYLEVDRSALSAELSKMKADGLIDYWKNHFKLLER